MGTLVYATFVSLDGFIADPSGGIGFFGPDEDMHRFSNARTRGTATFLFGRGLYEVWCSPPRSAGAT